MTILPGGAAPPPLPTRPAPVAARSSRRPAVVAVIVAAAVAVTGGVLVLPRLAHDVSAAAASAVAPAGVPHRVPDEAAAPLGRPAPAPVGAGGWRPLQTHPDGSPVTFDPCRPIHYVWRDETGSGELAKVLPKALAQLSTATGLRFVDDGRTDEPVTQDRAAYQPARYGDRWAPVLVVWRAGGVDAGQHPDALGLAGPASYGTSEKDVHFVTGSAVFAGTALDLRARTGGQAWVEAVVLHELGHLVGLDHVDDPYQVMYPANVAPLPAYRDGDLRGLEQLGLGRCVSGP
ncbi:MAG: matrixin family metalloprotease [Motilibacteraceae bacterium]